MFSTGRVSFAWQDRHFAPMRHVKWTALQLVARREVEALRWAYHVIGDSKRKPPRL